MVELIFKAGMLDMLGMIEEYDQNVQRVSRTKSTSGKINVQCCNCNGKGYYARDYPKPKIYDAKYSREQMLLATKDEA
uniref:Uncharacterized protein n=1 Tax=Tanacetum cinerariifolium TaxID=118510 RepID=A0A6L2L3Y7_TANCI|nr:hypothetical protein [Tanacetum cinerariifolium]